jgi:hypothetical protein
MSPDDGCDRRTIAALLWVPTLASRSPHRCVFPDKRYLALYGSCTHDGCHRDPKLEAGEAGCTPGQDDLNHFGRSG